MDQNTNIALRIYAVLCKKSNEGSPFFARYEAYYPGFPYGFAFRTQRKPISLPATT